MKKIFVLFILIFCTAISCSRLHVAVDWADTFAMSYATDYFDLDSAQKSQAREDFKKALLEVRKNEFPQMAALLNEATGIVEKNKLTLTELNRLHNNAETLIKQVYIRFEPLAQKLTTDQVKKGYSDFDKEFLKKFNKDIERASDPKKNERDYRKKIDRWIDNSIEFLTTDQKKSLQQQIQNNPVPKQLQLSSRKQVFEHFQRVRTKEVERRQFIQTLFTDWDSLQTPESRNARKIYQAQLKEWIISLYLSLNAEQRENLIANLKKRATEFQKLSLK